MTPLRQGYAGQAHVAVLVDEILQQFDPKPGDSLLDATVGLGGHARAWLEASDGTTVVGLDADPLALEQAKQNLAEFGDRVQLVVSSFGNLKDSVTGGGILLESFSHVLFDVGIGSHQLQDQTRGFSFVSQGPLTMRYGDGYSLPVSLVPVLNRLQERLGYAPDVLDIITKLSSEELATIIRQYSDEKYAKRIAQAIEHAKDEIQTAEQLAAVVSQAVPRSYERGRIHAATRTFQALRIAVNRELESIAIALPQAVDVLKPGGKLAIISFHSSEDRLVKQFFREASRACICPAHQPICICDHEPTLTILTKKPLVASPEEQHSNPRSRSAKLRVAQKIGP